MNSNRFLDVANACRFCFMCRHLSAVANVTFRESDTPRGRALIADTFRMHPESRTEPDFAGALYDSDLSGANRFHCVSHYDEVGLQLALRRDLVAAGNEPEAVRAVAQSLREAAKWTLDGKADTLFFVSARQTAARPSAGAAFAKLADAAGVKLATLTGGCIGKGLSVLGYADDALKAMERFADAVRKSGAKTLVVSNPAAYDALVNDFAAAGVKPGVEVKHTSGFLADLAAAGKLRFNAGPAVAYLESDYLKNYADYDGPRRLFSALGIDPLPFGTNREESYTAGEGAVVLDRLNPELVRRLAAYVKDLADPGVRLAVASAHTATVLADAGLDITTLEELAGERLC